MAALPELALLPIFGRPEMIGDVWSDVASRLLGDGECGLTSVLASRMVTAVGCGASE
jgi:hypothetical protein